MAYQDFADEQYFKTIDTSETPVMGTFQTADNIELQYIQVIIWIQDVTALGGSEQIRLNIYSEDTYTALLYQSNWRSISDITNLGSQNWTGLLRIDFNRENINKNLTYYVRAELQNYTRNADDFWIGLSHDFPFPIYDNGESKFFDHPLAMEIHGYKELT